MKQAKIAAAPLAQINVRIDRQTKEEGDAVLAEAGISPSQIVRDLWGRLAQRGDALDAVREALGSHDSADEERQAIVAKLAVVDRVERRRDALAARLGLAAADMPVYADSFDWHERVQAEQDRKRTRRGIS